MPRRRRGSFIGPGFFGLAIAGLCVPALAGATTLQSTATSGGNDPIFAQLTIDDSVVPGSLTFSLTMAGDADNVRIKGFASGFLTDSLLPDVTVTGEDVKRVLMNLTGDDAPPASCTSCDIALKLRKRGADPVATFTVTHATQSLGLDQVAGQDFVVLVGRKFGQRDEQHTFFFVGRKEYSLLEGEIGVTLPIPEPSTALLVALGLGGLTLAGRRSER